VNVKNRIILLICLAFLDSFDSAVISDPDAEETALLLPNCHSLTMKKVPSRCGSFSKSNTCALTFAALACLPSLSAFGESLSNNSEVNGNFTVGTTTTKGKLTVNAPQSVTSDLTVLGLQVSSAGGVFFGASSLGENLSYVPSVNSGFYFCAFDTAIQLGNFFVGANGWASISSGYYSKASGGESIAIGYQVQATGYTSAAFGNQSLASGTTSAAFGYLTDATGSNSFSAGDYSLASGVSSFAAGTGVTANSLSSAVFGAFNKVPTVSASAWVDADPLFTIGNGTADNQRSSALMVQKDGIVNLYPFGSTSASIVLNPKGTPSITVGGQKVVTSDSIGNIGVRAPATTSGVTIGSAPGSNEIVFTSSGTDAAEIMHLGNANLVLGTNNMARMTVTGGGTVGIGISSPNAGYQLDVANYSSLGGLRINGNDESNTFLNTNGKQISINPSAGNGITIKTTGAVVVGEWNVAAQQKFNVMGKSYFSDYVGIGNSTPTHELSIGSNGGTGSGTAVPVSIGLGSTFGNSTLGKNFKLRLFEAAATGPTADYGLGISANLLEFTAGTGADFAFFANGATPSELVRIKSNGNFGIGTTSPSAKLEVSGTVKFTKQGDIPMGEFGTNGD
jgi:hypothetical protein